MANGLRIVGREYELDVMRQLYNKEDAILAAIYGRRRVGKTYLVKHFLNEQYDFYFTGLHKTATAVQLSVFHDTLQRFSGSTLPTFSTWFQAFDALRDYLRSLRKDRIAVFLDEIPWMDLAKSNFLAAFSNFWNTWGSTYRGLKIFVCGSATTWMLDKFVGDRGGFYGRSNRSIYLAPFTLGETEQFLQQKGFVWDRRTITEAYMILGGIPYYLEMLDPTLPLRSSIDNLFFRSHGSLRQEFDFLFRSLFKDSRIYHQVVELLAKNAEGMTAEAIKQALQLDDSGSFTTVLRNLCKCDFIRSYQSFGKKERDMLYQLTDLYTLFYLRFVKPGSGQDEHFWTNISERKHDAWAGYAFEMVCLHHLPQIKARLGITGVEANVFSWTTKPMTDKSGTAWNGAQIDMIIERADNIINLCEMKYVSTKYTIDNQYAEHLRDRKAIFRHHTKTKASIHQTFITTFGVQPNSNYSEVQSEVLLDNLFG